MRAVLTAFFLLAAAPALADECDHAVSQNQLNSCAEDNYKAADKALNDAWSDLPDAAKAKLRNAQRDWIAQRETHCKTTASEAEGGSMYPLLYFGCLADKAKDRTRWLKAQAR